MAEKINEMKTISEKYDFSSENQSSEFILSEFSIKQEPELIIENEFETEKIQNYLQKSDITSDDRLGLVWYDCEICEERFLSQEDLSSHIKTHENPELYYTASANEIEESHINNDNKFKCNVCDRTFDAKESLEIHYPIHLKEGSFQCEQCHESFQYLRYLIAHRQTHIINETDPVELNEYKCYFCDLSFDTEDNLLQHYLTHTRYGRYKCESCIESFESYDSLRLHRRCPQSPYKCDRCDSLFTTKKILNAHLLTHKEQQFKCEFCRESFLSLANLMTHYQYHKSLNKCDYCNFTFTTKRAIEIHSVIHKKDNCGKCKCCNEYLRSLDTLGICRKCRKSRQNRYNCDRCDCSFTTKQFLDEHSLTHKQELPFKCEYCSESFQSLANLMTHCQSHKTEYKCDHCPCTFIKEEFLKTHYHQGHTSNTELFKKTIIPLLIVKQTTYIKEKPFKCQFCYFTTNRRRNLSQHHRRKHKTSPLARQ